MTELKKIVRYCQAYANSINVPAFVINSTFAPQKCLAVKSYQL